MLLKLSDVSNLTFQIAASTVFIKSNKLKVKLVFIKRTIVFNKQTYDQRPTKNKMIRIR